MLASLALLLLVQQAHAQYQYVRSSPSQSQSFQLPPGWREEPSFGDDPFFQYEQQPMRGMPQQERYFRGQPSFADRLARGQPSLADRLRAAEYAPHLQQGYSEFSRPQQPQKPRGNPGTHAPVQK